MTSFHHQPEAQHPKSSAIHKLVGRLPHLPISLSCRSRCGGQSSLHERQRCGPIECQDRRRTSAPPLEFNRRHPSLTFIVPKSPVGFVDDHVRCHGRNFQKSTGPLAFFNVAVIPFDRQQRIAALAGDEKFDCLCRLDVSFSLVVIRGACNRRCRARPARLFQRKKLLASCRRPL